MLVIIDLMLRMSNIVIRVIRDMKFVFILNSNVSSTIVIDYSLCSDLFCLLGGSPFVGINEICYWASAIV